MSKHSLQRETEVLAQHLEQILMIDQWGELEVKTAAQSDLIRTLLSMHQATHDEGQSVTCNPPSDIEDTASYTENAEQNVQPICTDAKTFPFAGEKVCALNQFIDATSDEDVSRGNSVNENDSTINKTSVVDFEDAAQSISMSFSTVDSIGKVLKFGTCQQASMLVSFSSVIFVDSVVVAFHLHLPFQ